jgi:nitrogen regulatory protein P-II 1
MEGNNVKKIEAIIEPLDVEEVKEGLAQIGIRHMAVTEVHGFGPSEQTQVYRGRRYEPPYTIDAKIEVVVRDEMAAAAIAVMGRKAKTDESGQSDVRLYSLEDSPVPAAGKRSAAAA